MVRAAIEAGELQAFRFGHRTLPVARPALRLWLASLGALGAF
ncbi:MAG TPA: hypothetical protein VGB53_05745 [Rubricoccaceae bacterium]